MLNKKDKKNELLGKQEDIWKQGLNKIFNSLKSFVKNRNKKSSIKQESNKPEQQGDEIDNVIDNIDFGDNDDPISKMQSMNTIIDKGRKTITGRLVLAIVIIPLLFFFLKVLYISAQIIYKDSQRHPVAKKMEKEIKLQVNSFTKWQEMKDEEIDSLNKEISKTKKELKGDINATKNELSKNIETLSLKITNELNSTVNQINENMMSSIKLLNDSILKNREQLKAYTDKKSTLLQEKVKELDKIIKNGKISKKRTALSFNDISLPELPSLKKSIKKSIKKVSIGKTTTSKSSAKSKRNKIVNYEEKEETIVFSTTKYSTLPKDQPGHDKKKKNNLPSFTLMPGFVKGTIVTGGKIPAYLNAKNSFKPVWISISGDMLIANDDSLNIDSCLLEGAATGDFATSLVNIRLSKLSCSIHDKEGNKYKILQSVKGWVYDENGQYGMSGRLITREGDIIKKGISLTLLESMIQAITNLTNKQQVAIPGTTNDNTAEAAIASGVQTGSTKVFSKFTDYYLKMLDALNPSIEVRSGRSVVIAFEGGEKITIEKYKGVDVDYFQNKDNE